MAVVLGENLSLAFEKPGRILSCPHPQRRRQRLDGDGPLHRLRQGDGKYGAAPTAMTATRSAQKWIAAIRPVAIPSRKELLVHCP